MTLTLHWGLFGKLRNPSIKGKLFGAQPKPVIPNRCNRKQPFSFSKRIYKLRWCDFRRIATRYDKLARNYLASVCPAAALVWWIQ